MDGTTIKDGQTIWFSNYDMAMAFMHEQMDIYDMIAVNFLDLNNRTYIGSNKWFPGQYLIAEAGGNGHDVLIELEHI